MQVFSLESVISLDSMGFSKGLDKAESKMKRFGKNLSNALDKAKKMMVAVFTGVMATQAVNAVRSLANATAAAGDKIDKQSQVLGMSRRAYQEWTYILSQAGGSIDDMSVSMKTLNNAILNGGQEAEESLGLIGLSVKDLQNLSQEDAFETVVRSFQKIPAGANKSAAAVKLFGRSGMDLLPLLNSDIYTIDILRAKAEELGLVMSDDAVDASVEYSDALDTLQRTFTGLKYAIGAKILPPLTNAFTQITGYAGKIRKAYDNKGLAGVFETLVRDIKAIHWPTWDDVSNAIVTGWNTIVDGVSGLAKIIFGENVDGTIDWPTWEEIGTAIGTSWKGIVDGVSNLGTTVGKLVFGDNVDGEIDWPTWDEIRAAIEAAWRDIVNGVDGLGTGIGKAVFGTNVDGTVKWPTWDEIVTAVQTAWRDIVNGVSDLGTTIGKVVFGENVDGDIDWPTWGEISTSIETAWTAIVNGVSGLGEKIGKAVFGENVDGEIDWPTWEDISTSVQDAWQGIVNGVSDLGTTIGKVLFGQNVDGTIKWPTWEDIGTSITSAWNTIKESVANLAKVVFGENVDGTINWPTWEDVRIGAITAWNKITEKASKIFKFVVSLVLPDWYTLKQSASDGWAKVTGALGDWVASIDIHIPTWSEIADAWNQFWDDVYKNLPDWVKDFLGFFGLGSGAQKQEETADQRLARLQKNIDDLNNELDAAAARAALIAQGTVPDEVSYAGGSGGASGGGTPHAIMDLDSVGGNFHHINGFHASGLLNVPYDNYSALLHEGEMVLTKSKAREYRQGESNGAGEIVAAIQGLRNDMQNLKLVVGQKTFGKAVVEYGGNRMDGYIGRADSRLAAGYGS